MIFDFEQELRDLINKHSLENQSNTPDFILSQYLIQCLNAFTIATSLRNGYVLKKPKSVTPKPEALQERLRRSQAEVKRLIEEARQRDAEDADASRGPE